MLELDGPVLVFGGCYSNVEPTVGLRRETASLGIPPHDTICTGDVVAYCADPVVWYSLFAPTRDGVEISLRALDYDAGTAARKMRKRGLPAGYADALETGLWPSCDVLPPRELSERGTPLNATSLVWNNRKAA